MSVWTIAGGVALGLIGFVAFTLLFLWLYVFIAALFGGNR